MRGAACSIRSGHAILSEGRKRIVTDHFIFVLFAAVEIFELVESIEIEEGELSISVANGAEIADHCLSTARRANRATSEWIWEVDLGAGVAAAEVRNAQVSAQ